MLKLKETRPPPPPNIHVLEEFFALDPGRATDKQVQAAASAASLSVQEVQRWLRHRSASTRLTPMSKFCETMWLLAFYTAISIYGYILLHDKSWYSDTRYCWVRFECNLKDDASSLLYASV